jgi:hypothetical protein
MNTDTLPATESLADAAPETQAADAKQKRNRAKLFLVQGATAFDTKRELVKYIKDNSIDPTTVSILKGSPVEVKTETKTEIVIN